MTTTADTLVPQQSGRPSNPAAHPTLLPTPPRRYGGRARIDDRAALAGVWQQQLHHLLEQLSRNSRLDWSRASLDSISVRAKRGAA